MASGLPAVRVLISDPNIFITFSLCSLCTLANPELAEGGAGERYILFSAPIKAHQSLSSAILLIRIPPELPIGIEESCALMKMTWDSEAEKILRRVPFFVRTKVRKKVEEEVAAAGRNRVTKTDLEESKRNHLKRLSEGVKGFSVEACFGSSGCQNAVVTSADLVSNLESLLEEADLLSFLRSQLGDHVKLHHQLRVTLADCPNGCSQPQIKDIGIIGQAQVACEPEECTACGECEAVCQESAIILDDGFLVSIEEDLCVECGVCARVCPSSAISTTANSYRVLVGGKLGRHPQLARDLTNGLDAEQVLNLVGVIVNFYKANVKSGERLGALINRVGWEEFKESVL
jgi:dissimilatory sulfite reductase (desulfoviridin) alpha/beta subunit